MIGPGMPLATGGGEAAVDPWEADAAGWRERERRQRTLRLLMMFLLMLLLMDGEEQSTRKRHDPNHLRKNNKTTSRKVLPIAVFRQRQEMEAALYNLNKNHARYSELRRVKNQGVDEEYHVRKWAEMQAEQEKDEFAAEALMASSNSDGNHFNSDPDNAKKVFHYPWNATGFYRGEWIRKGVQEQQEQQDKAGKNNNDNAVAQDNAAATAAAVGDGSNPITSSTAATTTNVKSVTRVTPLQAEDVMNEILRDRKQSLGVFLLPSDMELEVGFNISSKQQYYQHQYSHVHLDGTTSSSPAHPFLRIETPNSNNHGITLTQQSGRAAFQLYSRSIPAMKELSLLDGFVKLYNSNTAGYSTRRDILLRVRGIIIHSIGRISLVSSTGVGRSAVVIEKTNDDKKNNQDNDDDDDKSKSHRRLQEILEKVKEDEMLLEKARDDVLASFPIQDQQQGMWELVSVDEKGLYGDSVRRLIDTQAVKQEQQQEEAVAENNASEATPAAAAVQQQQQRSEMVIPFPYVPDDEDGTIRNTRTPAARRMPPREQLLEANAGKCEFEINMDVQEVEWTLGEWRKLVSRHVNEAIKLNPSLPGVAEPNSEDDARKAATSIHVPQRSSRTKAIKDQALVMAMTGSIHSPNCDFTASLNATAIRTDWEHTTGKAINYSFYMMLTCLSQIVVLLRQLLHTQAQSAATRVSLLCIGWQTVLDALLCLGHIYLSLAMQPLFTAFASVAFFKLLIFCVIEMKYMAIIIQARNNNDGGNTTELLRRQVAMLHLRFYVALVASFLAFYYAGEKYRTVYILGLYSFWVPQIIQNIITEAKRPLHTYYIYGMSFTRLVAPLYIFAVPNNFLKEVYPDSPTNPFMCELLFLWVGFQMMILIAQGRYGARFMIPARFLPPKFDYSRPIPPSLLPPGALDHPPTTEPANNNNTTTNGDHSSSSPTTTRHHHHTAGMARNRIKGSRVNNRTMTTEMSNNNNNNKSTVDCVICYNAIDVHNRRGYMLAPCDHLFHRSCLVQWMDVKMECPICRTELPSL